MHNKTNIFIIGMLLFSLSTVQADYGDIITQRNYDGLTFNYETINASLTTGNNGKIRTSCNGLTGICQALMSWDSWVDETINSSEYNAETNQSYISKVPTGNYISTRKTKLLSIPYLGYIRALRINQNYADRFIHSSFTILQSSKMIRILNHLEIRQTSQTIIVNS
jgi:hypothetical protein